jgi:hypothetical protein
MRLLLAAFFILKISTTKFCFKCVLPGSTRYALDSMGELCTTLRVKTVQSRNFCFDPSLVRVQRIVAFQFKMQSMLICIYV